LYFFLKKPPRRGDFTSLDWIIVIVYLILSVAIGMIGRRYVWFGAHYLVAGRELGLFVGIATLAATESALSPSCTTPSSATGMALPIIVALISGLVMVIIGNRLRHHPLSPMKLNDRSRIFRAKVQSRTSSSPVCCRLGGILKWASSEIRGIPDRISGINANISSRYDGHLAIGNVVHRSWREWSPS